MIINPYVFGAAYDPDAQAFFTASGLTGATNLNAINTLVVSLKGFGIWTKMKAIYPIIGGTAALHKWNLKDPQDTNAAFRLVFNGGWTHTTTGALPNGTNAFANTFLGTTAISLNSGSLSYYSRTNFLTGAINIDIGILATGPDSFSDLQLEGHLGYQFRFNNGGNGTQSVITDSRGFFTGSRTASNIINNFRNGTLLTSGSTTTGVTAAIPFYIGASNFMSIATYFANRECAFASLGDGLNATEAANFYTAVQAFQTTLTRNV